MSACSGEKVKSVTMFSSDNSGELTTKVIVDISSDSAYNDYSFGKVVQDESGFNHTEINGDGFTVSCGIIPVETANSMMSSHYTSDSYVDMTSDDMVGFMYFDGSQYYSVFDIGGKEDWDVYCVLVSDDWDSVYAVERGLTFNVVS
jgi:hypothetical protein